MYMSPCEGTFSITVMLPGPELDAELLVESFLVVTWDAFKLLFAMEWASLFVRFRKSSWGLAGKGAAGVEDSFGFPSDTAGVCPMASGDFLLARDSMTDAYAPDTEKAGVEPPRGSPKEAVGVVI